MDQREAEADARAARLLAKNKDLAETTTGIRTGRTQASARLASAALLPPAVPPAVTPADGLLRLQPSALDDICNEPGAEDIPVEKAKQLRRIACLNMYLHRRRNNENTGEFVDLEDPPPCPCTTCPFCSGPLLAQRYVLLQRVYQLNCALYGTHTAEDLLKYI